MQTLIFTNSANLKANLMFYIVFIDLANFNFLQRYRSVESDNVDEHAAVAMNGNGDEQHDDDDDDFLG